jgi:hypothetical protein
MSAPEIPPTQAVSREDVGHEASSLARHDGYARRIKTKSFKNKHDRTTRKTNNGQSTADSDSTDEEEADEDEESSSDNDDDEAEAEDPDMFAPPGVATNGTALLSHLASINDTSTELESQIETNTSQAGPLSSTHTPLHSRKRTLSGMSAGTLVDTIENDDQHVWPRKKVHRRLSSGTDGILKYDAFLVAGLEDDFAMDDYEEAIKSSDDDEDDDAVDKVDETLDSDVEKLEELMIIQEEMALAESIDDESAEVNSDDELLSDTDLAFLDPDADGFFFDQAIESEDEDDNDHDAASARFLSARKQSEGSVRRVRFEDEVAAARSSSDSSSDTDLDVFPDLLDQEDLPPLLRTDIEREIDLDTGNLTPSDGDGSCWDFGEDEASKNFFAWHDVHTESDSDGSDSDPGYDCMVNYYMFHDIY